jgi:hypothetical protein
MMVVAMCVAGFRLGIRVIGLEIDHQHAQRHAHLDRGEADAGRIVHRLEHVGDERAQSSSNFSTGTETCLRRGSGTSRISRMAMGGR